MSSRDAREPQLLRHVRSNKAFVVVRDEQNRRRQVTLGEWGSPEAHRRYHTELLKWHARQRGGAAAEEVALQPLEPLTIADACARWMIHVQAYYRDDQGKPTSEPHACRDAVRPLLAMFADEPIEGFTPRMLKAVRDRMVSGDPLAPPSARRGWCRNVVNRSVGRIRSFVRWCVAEGYVSPNVHVALTTLAPLKRGRCEARETEPRRPVAEATVEATLPHLPPMLADVARVQLLIGCRPGEILRACWREFDRSGPVWLFMPSRSKVAWKRKPTPYAVGPKAQLILAKYLRLDPAAFMFQPSASEAERAELRRAARKTKLWPSHVAHMERKRAEDPIRPPGELYDVRAYARAIRRATEKAEVDAWSPHQLRHLAATLARKRAGAEVARVVLTHSDLDATNVYAEADIELATNYARAHG